MFRKMQPDDTTRTTDASSSHFVLFDESNSQPFVFDDDAFGLYDAHGIHRRQYSTASLSTLDGITVLKGSDSSASRPQDDVFWWTSNLMGRFLNNLWFKRILMAIIIAQSILVAISTTKYVTSNEELTSMFWSVRQGFLCLFTVELSLRLIRYRFNIFRSGWLLFDVLVIGGSWLLPQLLVLRTFRVLRSLRHATRFHQIRDITMALGKVLPKAIGVLYFLIIIYYVFAVIFTSYYKDEFDEFRRLDTTFFTLFQVMTLDGWSELARRVMEDHEWAWLPFCTFITASAFFVVNFVVVIMIQGIAPHSSVSHEGSGHPESQMTRRLETKVDQLLGIVEAIRQKQNHMDWLVASMRTGVVSETATMSTVRIHSFEGSSRTDDLDFTLLKD